MMKKLLLLSSAVFALSFVTHAQSGKQGTQTSGQALSNGHGSIALKTTSSDTIIVNDVLHYYLNKVYYKAGTTALNNFPKYKNAAATVTNVTHCGSRFDVPAGDSITITGLEAYVQKGNFFPPSSKVRVHLYLCSLDANGNPNIYPPIDSIITEVGVSAVPNPILIGGNFTTSVGGSTVTNQHVMKNNYAVLFRNMSTFSGDTIYLLRTDGATQASVADIKYKYSDEENSKGFGFVRYLGNFYDTKNFTLAPSFGFGTQYEFIVAPRVTYLLQASQKVAQGVGIYTPADSLLPKDFVCTRQVMTFTNTSSKFYEHRMFNLNPFYLKWAQGSGFVSQPPGGFSADSAITWSFEFYDQALPARDSRVFLPYTNNETITAESDLSFFPLCFTQNEMRARLRPMGAFNSDPQIVTNLSFTVCMEYCNGDTVGIKTNEPLTAVKLFPNPSVNGKTRISGLNGSNTLHVFNMIGQQMTVIETNKSEYELDLSNFPNGSYLIRIVNDSAQSKTIKVIHQN